VRIFNWLAEILLYFFKKPLRFLKSLFFRTIMIFDLFIKNNTENNAKKFIDLYMACSLSLAIKTDMEDMSFKIGESFFKIILAN
jgi:hypothetical protein